MDVPQPLRFGVPIHFDAVYEDVFAPEFDAVYTKCSSTIWVDVGFPE